MNRYPLSRTEYGIYSEQLSKADTTYNLPYLVSLDENVDIPRLTAALRRAVELHPAMKTGFAVDENGDAYQYLRDCEVEVREVTMEEPDFHSLIRPFDLQNDVLFRFTVIHSGKKRWLLCDVHHIIYDAASHDVFLSDVDRLYRGERVAAEVFGAREYALEEAKRLNAAEYEEAKDYYQGAFEGVDVDSSFFTDQNGRESRNREMTYRLEKVTPAMLREAADRFGVKLSTLLLAGFAFLLSRYSGSEQVLFSTVWNGRDKRLRRAIGMFVRIYPVFADLSGDMPVGELIRRLEEHVTRNRENSLYSFADFCADTKLKPRVMFAYEGDVTVTLPFCGGRSTVTLLPVRDVKNVFELMIRRCEGGFTACAEYDQSLYDDAILHAMLESYDQVLLQLISAEKLSQINMLTEAQERLLDEQNRTESDYERSDIITLFRRQADALPDQTAVVYLDQTLSYSELDQVTENIAVFLRSKGIGSGNVVSVLIPRCEYIPIASLGVLKAGAAYQPLDPSYPVDRLRFMIEDADARYLIADRSLMERLPDYHGPVLYTDEIPSLPDAPRSPEHPKPEDLFIVLYTSGSTGVPKGVMLEHGQLCSFCSWYRKFYELNGDSRVAAYASYGFDADMMDLYPALTGGAQVYILEESIRLDLLAIKDYFCQNRITHSFLTTQIGRQYADIFPDAPYPHYLTTGGEKLVPVAPPVTYRFYNAYGPTECTIVTNLYPVHRVSQRVPVGRPMDNLKEYVVDPYGKRVPPGVPGELIIAGHQIGRGYLNRPDQNEKAFIPNPFSREPGYEKAYRTGDIVRMLSDGSIDFLGRNDGQVKIRGYRVELSEVEEIIHRFPGIKDATVQAFDDDKGGKFIAAYVVSEDIVHLEALDNFILANKPPYMVPAVTMQLDRIPLTQNQKVNRRALPVPEKRGEDSEPPHNEVQKTIFDCIAKVIGSTAFGIHTDLFYAGLTSIGAIRLNVMLSRQFGVSLSLSDLRQHNTVASLEQFLSASSGDEHEVLSDYPLTRTQMSILVECLADPGETVYHLPRLFRLSDRIDLSRMKRAVEAAVNAHPYLKAELITGRGGEIRASRHDNAAPAVELIRADALPRRLSEPFSLLNSRLYRARIYQTGEGNYLYLEFHQLICDPAGESIILQDINAAYRGQRIEAENVTGFEAALEEEQARRSERYTKAKAYYHKLLEGVDAAPLPVGDVSGGERTFRTIEVPSVLDMQAVRRFCRTNGVSERAFFHGVFAFVLSKYCYGEEVVYATVCCGRNEAGLSRTVTMMINTLPVYCRLEGERSVAELVEGIEKQLSDSMTHHIYSFSEIASDLGIPADIQFVYRESCMAPDLVDCQTEESRSIPLGAGRVPLNVDISVKNEKAEFACSYRSDLYSEGMMKDFLLCLETAAKEFLSGTRLRDISIMTDAARRMTEAFNASETEIPALTCDRLLEEQVRLNPLKTAVMAGDQSLTYQQLNRSANMVAHGLLRAEVEREEIVGVMVPRSCSAYAAREGVLKAGGAYLPLLPDSSDGSLRFMLRDAGVRLVLTTEELAGKRQALFDGAGVEVLVLEQLLASDHTENPGLSLQPHQLCCCLYPSREGEISRGVLLEHHTLVNLVNWNPLNPQACAFCDNMTVLTALAPLTDEASVLEEAMGLYHGAAVALAREEERADPALLADMIRRTGGDVMHCTPSFLEQLLREPRGAEALGKMKAIILGEEAIPAPLYERLRSAGVGARLYEGFGSPETGITALAGELNEASRPICNVKAVLLDPFGHELPPLVPGELTLLGACVARGYRGDEQLTKKRFFTYCGMPAVRSGVLARRSREGKLLLMGRLCDRIRLKGRQILPHRVEQVMNAYPGVTHSVVLVREDEGTERLCGFCTVSEPVDTDLLRGFMSRRLPLWMIPEEFVFLDSIPLTPDGRVDKRALTLSGQRGEQQQDDSPRTDLQKKLCELFCGALGIEKAGVDRSFFRLGGTSLSAARLVMNATREDLPISLKDVFDYPTVRAMEKYLSTAAKKQEPVPGEEEHTVSDSVLANNTISAIGQVCQEPYGNVLLTGASGFLGIHVLKKLLEKTDKTVYCLLRRSNITPEAKLRNMLLYYFDDPMTPLFDSRIRIIEGDLTDRKKLLSLGSYDFDTVINCASCVKPSADDDTLERINVFGVQNLIDLCVGTNRRLVQISTVQVAGTNVNHQFPPEKKLCENELYFGQHIGSSYVSTKFKAEQSVLKAVENQGLNGRIIRVGNLMSRYEDGQFQINSVTNSFMNSLRAYAAIGSISVSVLDEPVEFSPVDCTAEAIVALAGASREFTVFHATNAYSVQMGDVIEAMNRVGVYIEVADEEDFAEALRLSLSDDYISPFVKPLLSYLPFAGHTAELCIGHENAFTAKVLYRLGFKWPIISESYLKNVFVALEALGYFDGV